MTHLACYAYGAGHADEGVCLGLEIDNYHILLDCGLKNLDALIAATDESPWDLVLCTHAHADHGYGLLELHSQFRDLPIYTSPVTARLLPLNWIGQAMPDAFCRTLPWHTPLELLESLTVELIPAGHLPGASAFLISYQPQAGAKPIQVIYTGDFFLSNTRLADGLRLEEIRGLMPDALIVSGSYGIGRYSHRRHQETRLLERVSQAIEAGQSVLLPVPTLGLGQELLFLLRSQSRFSGRELDIWVNGAVAMGCDTYEEIKSALPIAVQNFAQYQPLFWDEKISPRTYRGIPPQDYAAPCIVITDTHTDITQFCHHGEWIVMLPEATVATFGWQINAAKTNAADAIVTAETYWLSEHSDRNATCQLIHNLRPQHVLFIHGDPEALADLATLEELSTRYKVHVPHPGKTIELPVMDETQIHSSQVPETRFEGEVAETSTEILIALPTEFRDDPRWQKFADTGVVEAYWEDEQLVIRGMSAQELTNNKASTLSHTCANCQFYRNQSCSSTDSPLFQLQVTPDGYCWAFTERLPS